MVVPMIQQTALSVNRFYKVLIVYFKSLSILNLTLILIVDIIIPY